MNKVDKFKMVIALALASIVVYNLVMFISQETCSDYSCPDGYVNNDNKKDEKCDSLECSEVDIPKCCNKSVNCEGSWSDFSECSVECGGGTQTKTYTVTTQPQYGGTPCPTSPESQACNTQACAICSSFQCPDNYSSRADVDGVSCGKTQCDSSNIDLCCENIQGGDAGVTGVVANATCSSISTDGCPDGYLYNTDSAERECNGPTCDVGIGGVDLNTCCEQGCSAPSSLPSGYAGNLPATLPVGSDDIIDVQCDANYNGTPRYTCNGVGEEYILDGCGQPIDCVVISTQYSLCSGDCGSRGTKTATYAIGVEAQYGGNPCPTTEEIPCDTRACATCNSYQCPEGYIPKSGVGDVSCGNYDCNIDNRDTCCEVGQLHEEQDTELPICSEVMTPNKIPDMIRTTTRTDNLQNCSDLCASLPICQSFAYSDIDPEHDPRGEGLTNCIISESIETIDPYGRFINEDYLSWSFYPKCRVSQSGGQTPEVQESPQLPFCSDIKIPNKMALGNLTENLRIGDVGTCIDTCFTQRDNCNSFSYGRVSGRCYFYGEENITEQQQNDDYDYYPVKCQP